MREKIIRPRFAELQREWKQNLVPRIATQADAITSLIGQLPADAEGERVTAAALRGQVAAIASEAARFEATLPANDDWWRTVAGKGRVAEDIGDSAVSRLKTGVAAESARRLEQLAADAVASTKALEHDLETSIAECAENFKRQTEQAETLAKPLAAIALDLHYVTINFPLLLSFALAAAIFWPAYWKLQLARAYARLMFKERDARAWGTTFGWLGASRLRPAVPVAAALVWIAIAGWQLQHWTVVSPPQSLILTAIALVPIAAAAASVWWIDATTRQLCGGVSPRET